AEVTLLPAPIAVGVLLGTLDRFLRGLPQLAAPAPIALGELHDFVLALQARDVAGDARHGFSLHHQEALESALVGMRDEGRLAQMALPFGMLLGQDVALVGAM